MRSKSGHADDFYLFETLQYRRRQIVNPPEALSQDIFSSYFLPFFLQGWMKMRELQHQREGKR